MRTAIFAKSALQRSALFDSFTNRHPITIQDHETGRFHTGIVTGLRRTRATVAENGIIVTLLREGCTADGWNSDFMVFHRTAD